MLVHARLAGRRSARPVVRPGALAVVDGVPVDSQQRQHCQRPDARRQTGDAPTAGRGRDADQEHRRHRPAQVAGDAVDRERMAQARRRNALVQDREVGRMERRIAEARQRRGQQQPGIALRAGRRQRGDDKAAERREQHRPRADAIDQKPGQRLPDAGDEKEDADQQPQFRVAEAEFPDQRREQRRQQHVEEMRGAMRQADQADGREIGTGAARAREVCGQGAHPGTVTRRDERAQCRRIERPSGRVSAPRARTRTRRPRHPPESHPWARTCLAGSAWPPGSRSGAGSRA